MDGLVVSLSRETFGDLLGCVGAWAGEPITGFWFFVCGCAISEGKKLRGHFNGVGHGVGH